MPAVTPSDVVLYPVYKRHDKAKIERIRLTVDLYESFQRVNKRIRRFELSERVRGNRYKGGVWADAICKSELDTCVCSLVSGECYAIVQSLNKLL